MNDRKVLAEVCGPPVQGVDRIVLVHNGRVLDERGIEVYVSFQDDGGRTMKLFLAERETPLWSRDVEA